MFLIIFLVLLLLRVFLSAVAPRPRPRSPQETRIYNNQKSLFPFDLSHEPELELSIVVPAYNEGFYQFLNIT